jgi:signal transduction histidine kinase
MVRHRPLIVYLVACLAALGSTLRYMWYFVDHPSRWAIFGLLAAFYVLLAVVPWLYRRSQLYVHLYLAVQTFILGGLAIVTTIEDVVALPFLSLILLAMTVLPPRIGFRWIGLFTVLMVGSMIALGIVFHGMDTGMILLTALVYVASYFGFGTLVAVLRQLEIARNEAEVAHKKSEELLAELQVAHRELQAYTARAEEMAVLQERSRLARELHDSVSQALHSSTLLAEAGQRLAGAGDIERARGYLIRLGEISQQALREMRLLVYELRPLALSGVGLVGALQRRLDAVERRSGVEVELSIEEELGLPAPIEEALFWIAMEALNNALKHANPTTVTVSLRKEEQREMPCIELLIIDDGVGFDLDEKDGEGGVGLVSMKERIEKLGGELTVLSASGEGTHVKACVGLETSLDSPNAMEV